MEINIVTFGFIMLFCLLMFYTVGAIQNWWYKRHPYVSKERLPYEVMKDCWDKLHNSKKEEDMDPVLEMCENILAYKGFSVQELELVTEIESDGILGPLQTDYYLVALIDNCGYHQVIEITTYDDGDWDDATVSIKLDDSKKASKEICEAFIKNTIESN